MNNQFRKKQKIYLKKLGIVLAGIIAACGNGFAETTDAESTSSADSPWMVVPLVSSNPKLGTSAGVLGAYLHRFDPKSTVSMLGVMAKYTTTDSRVGGAFARTFFGEDHHRLFAMVLGGTIHNDYDDFLNSGRAVQTDDNLRAIAARYQYRVKGPWFVGAQAIDTNYAVVADDALSEEILDQVGLAGFDSVGVGAVLSYDARDNVNSPSRGLFFDVNNIAYQEGLGGDVSFDAYRFTLRQFFPHGAGHVFAWKFAGHWTQDAPPGGYASLHMRGYTSGEYLGRNMSSLEAEEQLKMGDRWGITAFAGVACLYGGGMSCDDRSNLYSNMGGGLYYVLKPKEKMVATVEFADGEGSQNGFYMRMGWGF